MEVLEINQAFSFIRNGVSVKQNSDAGGLPITRIETIANEVIDPKRVGFANINEQNLGKYENYILVEGDILMSHINSPKHLGKSAIYNGTPHKLVHGMNLICLRANLKICLPKFAKYYFQSGFFKNDLLKISNQSVNQASFSVGKLKNLKIPLPPLETQKRIAQILDDAAALRDKTAQLLKEYDLLAQSIFLDMFEYGRTTNQFPLVEISRVCSKASKINRHSSHGSIEYVDISSVDNSQNIITSTTNYTLEERPSRAQQILKKGDVIYSTVRPNLKNIAIVNNINYIGSTGFVVLRVKSELNNLYLFYHLKSDNFTNYVLTLVSGANYPAIKQSIFFDIKIPVPPIQLQNQFAEKIALIEQQKALAKQELQESEDLFNCLLQKAFKGELV